MKRLFLAVSFLFLFSGIGFAQSTDTVQGYLSAEGTTCAVTKCVTLSIPAGSGSVGIQISGTFTADIEIEATIDGSNYLAVSAFPLTAGASVTQVTAAGAWRLNAAGLKKVRVRCSDYTSGLASVTIVSSPASYVGTPAES